MPVIALLALGACAPESDDAAGLAGGDTAAAVVQESTFAPLSDDGMTVAQVDPERYLGVWYEIATTPSFQQTSCANTTAEYSLIDDETVGVLNRCTLGVDGPENIIEGTARVVDDSYARLLVDLGFGFEAPYDIVELDGATGDAPYRYAAVSSMGFQWWILSREPVIDDGIRAELEERLEARGLDLSTLVDSEHAR